jgi:hypothetical protein
LENDGSKPIGTHASTLALELRGLLQAEDFGRSLVLGGDLEKALAGRFCFGDESFLMISFGREGSGFSNSDIAFIDNVEHPIMKTRNENKIPQI